MSCWPLLVLAALLSLCVLSGELALAEAALPAPIVRLETEHVPKLLLSGVSVPVSFSLLATAVECGGEAAAGEGAEGGCELLVEAVLDNPNCVAQAGGSADLQVGGIRGRICGDSSLEQQDVSSEQDCGILKQTLAPGSGTVPPPGTNITVHYTGRLESGTVFDSSRDQGDPFTFQLGAGHVIACWDQAFATMTTGERAVLTCTAPYAYGNQGAGGVIPPGATLIFDVELLSWTGGGEGASGSHEMEPGGSGKEEARTESECGRMLGSTRVSVSALTQMQGEVRVSLDEIGVYNLLVRVQLVGRPGRRAGGAGGGNTTVLAVHKVPDVRVIPGILCLLPAAVIVVTAVYSKNVVLALLAGLSTGGTLTSGYNPVLGFMRGADTFLYGAVQKADQGLLLFTWFMSGLVGLVSRNGGAAGLGRVLARYATTPERAQIITALAGLGIFFDDYASILIVGPMMRPLTDARGISREKLAFLVDSMAAPVASVSLVSTWIGFKLGVVQQQLHILGIKEDGLSVLVRATTYSFYPIFAIFFALLIAASGRDFGPMRRAELKARERLAKQRGPASAVAAGFGEAPGRHTDSDIHTDTGAGMGSTDASASIRMPGHLSQSPTPNSSDPLAPNLWSAESVHVQEEERAEGRGRGCAAVEVQGSGVGSRDCTREAAAAAASETTGAPGRQGMGTAGGLAAALHGGTVVGDVQGGTEEEREGEGREEEEGEECGRGLVDAVDPQMVPDPSKPMRAMNAVAPVGVMLVGMVGGIVASGVSVYYREHPQGAAAPAPSMVHVLSHAETTKVLIWSSLLACMVAKALAVVQKVLTVEECMEAWIAGMRSVTVGLMTLLFAWGVGEMSQTLHVGPFMAQVVGSAVTPVLLPTAVTVVSALVSVASGSSWGAMVILFPTVLPLALVGSSEAELEYASKVLVGTIGGVISGSMFGDHVSPISDTTVLTSLCTGCHIVSLVNCQASYCALVLAVSILAALLTAAMPESVGVLAYPLGCLLLYASLRILSAPPSDEQGREDRDEDDGIELEGFALDAGAGIGRGRVTRHTVPVGLRGGSGGERASSQGSRGRFGWGWVGEFWWGGREGAGERDGLVHYPDGFAFVGDGDDDSQGTPSRLSKDLVCARNVRAKSLRPKPRPESPLFAV
jgi:Na+/H+ antiporter NhaC